MVKTEWVLLTRQLRDDWVKTIDLIILDELTKVERITILALQAVEACLILDDKEQYFNKAAGNASLPNQLTSQIMDGRTSKATQYRLARSILDKIHRIISRIRKYPRIRNVRTYDPCGLLQLFDERYNADCRSNRNSQILEVLIYEVYYGVVNALRLISPFQLHIFFGQLIVIFVCSKEYTDIVRVHPSIQFRPLCKIKGKHSNDCRRWVGLCPGPSYTPRPAKPATNPMLQSTRVRLNLVRDMRRELEQRWSPRERKLPPGPAGPLYAL